MRVYIREDIILNLTNNILFVNNCIILFLIDAEQLLLLFLDSEYEINSYNFNIFFNITL